MSSEPEKDKYDDYFKTAREYLDYFYSDMMTKGHVDEGLAMPWILQQFHRTFTQDRDFGRRLLDVGSGPTVYQLISASRVCPEIICSDIHKGALEEIKKWKNSDPNAFDWTDVVKYVSGLEGMRWEYRQGQLRNAIKDAVICDVLNEYPLHPAVFQPFDTVISAYGLEGASWDKGRSTYAKTVQNTCSLLKPGGYFISMSYIGVTYYIEGGEKWPDSLCLDTEFVLKSLSEAGITVLEKSVYKTPEREECIFSDVRGILYVIGKKQ
ncbi:PREDICTED: nicotinamide N-methyltransferase-like [Branchiostoma belcheri]|uniref:Nicotinamide N-methyltransferase-like n=1 Tax=Branchiostoma belcheri TaxID=7741 RepID=A0A6P4ZC12_BRABE|nr:PREDICTED: nicotinamide N-methyltransferase-like [Branchiostoma belcheri]